MRAGDATRDEHQGGGKCFYRSRFCLENRGLGQHYMVTNAPCVRRDLPLHAVVQNMLCYDPQRRISAKDAMDHLYFDNLNPAIKNMGIERP